MSGRVKRVAESIKEELGLMLERGEIKDPRIGFVTLTEVEITKDLRHAKVYYSAMGSRKEREQAGEGLDSATGFMRRELGKRMRLKHTPEIEFIFDESVEIGARISKLIHKIHQEDNSDS